MRISPLRGGKVLGNHSGVYRCEWAPTSAALLAIAGTYLPDAPIGATGHRNLDTFPIYFHYQKEHPDLFAKMPTPVSFWIRSVEWDETRVVELARHLNFFMMRYDRGTPRIAIFEAPSSDSPKETGARYPFGPFPPIIVGRPLESYLMTIWETAVSEDPFKRFLYAYQILEYSAFYYVDDDTLGNIRKLILAPDAPSRLNAAVHEIVDAVMQMKMAEPQKLHAVVKKYVDPEMLWKHVEPHADIFCNEVVFDGGFSQPALCKHAPEDFRSTGMTRLADHFRSIRNAIAHSRDTKQMASILPTLSNHDRLRPWAMLMSVVATEVMLFRDVAI